MRSSAGTTFHTSVMTAVSIAATVSAAPRVQFNRDVLPILSDACFKCHGPDATKRKADLRLDMPESVFVDRDGHAVIVPGSLDQSEIIRRITATDPDQRMPPPNTGRSLTPQQIDAIKQWIEQGATWQRHWSFVPPERPALPRVSDPTWLRNPIDAFVLARLDRESLVPAPQADRTTLIRRVTFDLTGLPPTLDEVDAFLADTSPDAYDKVVDRLLASSHYGERMAARWLDAARYADTSGYQNDGPRDMWRWRDWVIDAYNANMPFDAFTVEQLAGDMLPDATLEQRIATGFNRNHRGNAEGGIIPEEYAVEYVVDRVETTATVWLGLTLGCARCHNHKYDPIAQKEFYRVFAYFNNVPERGKAVKIGNSPPMIPAPTRAQRERLAALQAERTTAQKQFAATEPALNAALAAWASSFTPGKRIDWSVSTGLLAHYDLEGHTVDVHGDGGAGAFIAGSDAFASGRLGLSGHFDGERFIDAGDVAKFDFFDKFSLGAWVRLDDLRGGTIVSRMTDVNQGDGYALVVKDGRIQVNLVKRWLDDAIRVETDPLLEADTWRHVMATYDGSRVASGVTIYVDGSPVEFNILVDELNQSFDSDQPLRIGAGGGPDERFRGRIDEVRIYDTCLSAASVALVATDASITEILATPAAKRNPEHADKLRAYFLAQHAPPEIRQAQRRVLDLDAQHERLIATFPTVMVMQERKQPRPTFVLARGAYDQPGEPVSAGVPASLSARSDNGSDAGPNDRVGFARWLVDPSNPLTARVAVNRYWQMYFGTGLVKTSEDFGTQGERPSHPMLLDWLASEFMHRGWDVKAMQRAIVTSATYRQSSHATPAMRRRDPDNRLLAHGPRFRLPAEAIRDQALAVSGLLTRTLCGPSVKPYQPEGLWNEIATTNQYDQSTGADLYRRSLYTYWKRTVAPPSMMTFDAAGREMCSVRSSRTNTPLQALTLLNDVTFVEASRALAERMITEGGSTPEQRIAMGFRLATARAPQPRELAVLVRGLEYHRQRFGEEREAGVRLMNVGESPRNDALDVTETAAYATIAGLILNLDEVVTKE